MADYIVFKCPKCGGDKWTDVVSEVPNMRFCTGVDAKGVSCTFSWPEYSDWQHFALTIRFRNSAEFAAAKRVQQGFTMLDMLRGKS